MRRLLLALCALTLMAGSTSVTKRLPLRVEIGNQSVDDITGVWPYDYITDTGAFRVEADIDLEFVGGVFYQTPLQGTPSPYNILGPRDGWRHRWWWDTSNGFTWDEDATFFNLTGSELYFRWSPMRNEYDGTYNVFRDWYGIVQFYDFGEAAGSDDVSPFPFSFHAIEFLGDGPDALIGFTIADDVVDEYIEIPWDPVNHKWFRITHDISTGTIAWWTAPSCGTWTKQLEGGPMVNRVTSFSIEFSGEVYSGEADPVEADLVPGYIGPLNEQPSTYRFPLKCEIGDPKVPGLTARLPLNVEIGNPS